MSLFRSTSDPSFRERRDESTPPITLHEAILASSSSIRDSLPEQHRAHFETLRQEIIDFAKVHGIPRDALTKSDVLREAASKLSTPDLTQLATLLERFEYLLVHHEPKKEDYTEAIEHAERLYHLKEQYDSQVKLLERAGILKEGAILGIDGKKYLVPTLEQIAVRLFERHNELETKRDQGFTKLLLVPFGMSLDALREILKQFLLDHKKSNPDFDLDTNEPLWTWEDYQGADIGDSPDLVYYPQSFIEDGHGGKTKMEILEEQTGRRWTLPPTAGSATGGTTSVGVAGKGERGVAGEEGRTSPGWTIHLLQSPDPSDPHSLGFAIIPRQGQGTPQGDLTSRPPLESGKTPNEYLSILKKAQDNPNSPYFQESGMTPEDWIMAFMIHLHETRQPLDNYANGTESISYLTGVFFHSSVGAPCAGWCRDRRQARLGGRDPRNQDENIGLRSSVIV